MDGEIDISEIQYPDIVKRLSRVSYTHVFQVRFLVSGQYY